MCIKVFTGNVQPERSWAVYSSMWSGLQMQMHTMQGLTQV